MGGMPSFVWIGVSARRIVALSFVGMSRIATIRSPARDSTRASCLKYGRGPAIGLFMMPSHLPYAILFYMCDWYDIFYHNMAHPQLVDSRGLVLPNWRMWEKTRFVKRVAAC